VIDIATAEADIVKLVVRQLLELTAHLVDREPRPQGGQHVVKRIDEVVDRYGSERRGLGILQDRHLQALITLVDSDDPIIAPSI
jgi:hypothetical protein